MKKAVAPLGGSAPARRLACAAPPSGATQPNPPNNVTSFNQDLTQSSNFKPAVNKGAGDMDIRERKVPSLEAYARAERSQVESQTRHYTNRTNNVTSFNQDLTFKFQGRGDGGDPGQLGNLRGNCRLVRDWRRIGGNWGSHFMAAKISGNGCPKKGADKRGGHYQKTTIVSQFVTINKSANRNGVPG